MSKNRILAIMGNSAFESLTLREQRAAVGIATGQSLKEVSAETGFNYATVRKWVSSGSERNDTLVEAIRELKTEMANSFKGLGAMIADRARQELQHGEGRDAAAFAKIYVDFCKTCPEDSGAKQTKIGTLINQIYNS